MTAPSPAAFVAALKAEGLAVTAHAGWTEVNRPGPWDPEGLVLHHTGPWSTVAGMLDLLRKGRSDLPGPLCVTGGRPSGIVDLVGWHDTNHAGAGDSAVLAAMRKEQVPPAPRSGHDDTDGNAVTYGHEMIHSGSAKDPWPKPQVHSAVLLGAAVIRLHRARSEGWTPNRVIYHKGWSTRKPDPVRGTVDGHRFPTITAYRGLVREQLKTGRATHTITRGQGPNEVADLLGVTVHALWNANRSVRWEPGAVLTIPS